LTWAGHAAYLRDVPSQKLLATFAHPSPAEGVVNDVVDARFLGADESRVLTRDNRGTALVYDRRRPRDPVRLEGFREATFSDDGSRALTWEKYRGADGSAPTATLWDLATCTALARFVHESGTFGSPTQIGGGSLSRDGTRVVTWADDQRVRFWRTESPHLLGAHEHESYRTERDGISPGLAGALLSPDGSVAISWDAFCIYVWDLSNWDAAGPRRLTKVPDKKAGSSILDLDAERRDFDRKWVSVAAGRLRYFTEKPDIALWELDLAKAGTNPPETLMPFRTGGIAKALFNRERSHVITWGSSGGRATLWDLTSQKPQGSYELGNPGKRDAWSPAQRRIFTENSDGTLLVWELGGEGPFRIKHDGPIVDACFGEDGRLVTAGEDRTARVWDATTRTGPRSFDNDPSGPLERANRDSFPDMSATDPVVGAVVSPDRRHLTTWSERTARLWDVETGKAIATFDSNGSNPRRPRVSPDGRLLVSREENGTVSLRGFEAGFDPVLLGKENEVKVGPFSADSAWLMVWEGTKVRVWDTARRTTSTLITAPGAVNDAFFRHRGSRVFVWADKIAGLYEADGGRMVGECRVVPGSIEGNSVERVVSPSGRYVLAPFPEASASPGLSRLNVLKVWDTVRKKDIATLPHEGEREVEAVAFSEDEPVVVTKRSGTVWLWDVARATTLATLSHTTPSGEEETVDGVTLSPDTSRVLTRARGPIRLWDVATERATATFEHADGVKGSILNEDGARILTWGKGGAFLWDVGQQRALATFPHGATVLGAAFDAGEDRVLTWGDVRIAIRWDITIDEINPIATQIRDFEARTATTIDPTGRYRPLSRDDWNARKAKR